MPRFSLHQCCIFKKAPSKAHQQKHTTIITMNMIIAMHCNVLNNNNNQHHHCHHSVSLLIPPKVPSWHFTALHSGERGVAGLALIMTLTMISMMTMMMMMISMMMMMMMMILMMMILMLPPPLPSSL